MSTATKEITHTTHPDGRKDVKISVNRLDVDAQDQATKDAKEVIENKVLPKLAETPVIVVVLHKPTNQHSEKIVPLKHVRAYAEAAVRAFLKDEGTDLYYTRLEEFAIIEHHLESGQIKVSTL